MCSFPIIVVLLGLLATELKNMLIKNYYWAMKIMDCIEKQGEIVRSRRH